MNCCSAGTAPGAVPWSHVDRAALVVTVNGGGMLNGGGSGGGGGRRRAGSTARDLACRLSIFRLLVWSAAVWIMLVGLLIYFANLQDETVNRLEVGAQFDLEKRKASWDVPQSTSKTRSRVYEAVESGKTYQSIVKVAQTNATGSIQAPRNGRIGNSSSAPGEMGEGVQLPSNDSMLPEMRAKVGDGWKEYGYNAYVSDMISVRRTLPDVRHPECKAPGLYPQDLPPASVIICFHNEGWAALLRSVHSVLDRSPGHLLKEVILVDDFSVKVHLKQKLDDYLVQFPKVRVIRMSKREGLIRSRMAGARNATAPVLIFLDSHIEATEGWLEPLLSRIHIDWSNVAVPIIDSIADASFKFKGHVNDTTHIGDFDWNLFFHWQALSGDRKSRLKSPISPVPTPTMAGGLFAIGKQFFQHLGAYDEVLDFWGGENMELSFKTWLCGGSLETIPCSRVGHVFRTKTPLSWPFKGKNAILRNTVRVARVWLDEYIELFYSQAGQDKRDWGPEIIGDLGPRFALRTRLNCKPFRWYLQTVFPEKFAPRDPLARGEIRNTMAIGEDGYQHCLDSDGGRYIQAAGKKVNLHPCHEVGGNQNWHFLKTGHIRKEMGGCLYVDVSLQNPLVVLKTCDEKDVKQQWMYDHKKFRLHPLTIPTFCAAVRVKNMEVIVEPCEAKRQEQLWLVEKFLNATF